MSDVEARLERLRTAFRARCREDLAALSDPAADLRPTLHRLAGAAGTFGYGELSRLAAEAEDAVVEGRVPDPALMARLRAALSALADRG